jgi:4-hydroxythreonine-4-phosphate dehydrogenase
MNTTAPLLVTMGDPAGIGPELVARAHLAGELHDAVIVGEPQVFARGLLACITADADAAARSAALTEPVFNRVPGAESGLDWAKLAWGEVNAACGAYAARCLQDAVVLVRESKGRAIITAPIHKGALAAAGVPFPGHTEMLQAWANPAGEPLPARMMLANDELRVVLVTIHQSLRSAIEAVTFDRVLETILITHQALLASGVVRPSIAVAGLNPHAGEGGLFGREEIEIIAPAIAAARAQGIEVSGPYAPDTVFMRARHTMGKPGDFDAVVAMTHDHGLIPVKYLGLDQGVNITLGLPFVRTSPDHGTAFDIAGRGVADPRSFLAALDAARQLSRGRAAALEPTARNFVDPREQDV